MSATLRFDNIGKVFPGVRALDGVSFDVHAGEVHGLMGENGAGKSTLLKILGGEYQPDSGRVLIDGNEVHFPSAAASIAAGHRGDSPGTAVRAGSDRRRKPAARRAAEPFGWVNKREAQTHRDANASQAMGVDLDPNAKLRKLSIAQRQMVEICKALLRNARVIALDEPTSSLSHRETEVLFKLVRDLRADNRALIYISHRMDEIYELCDACTIFRDGRKIASHPTLADVPRDTLVQRNGRPRNQRHLRLPAARSSARCASRSQSVEGHALRAAGQLRSAARRDRRLLRAGGRGPQRTDAPRLRRRHEEGRHDRCSTASRSRCAAPAKRSATASCCVRKTARKKASSRWRRSSENINISCRRHYLRGGIVPRPQEGSADGRALHQAAEDQDAEPPARRSAFCRAATSRRRSCRAGSPSRT